MNATAYYINNKLIFESILFKNERLIIINSFLQITEKRNIKINLKNNFTARLTNILIILNIKKLSKKLNNSNSNCSSKIRIHFMY